MAFILQVQQVLLAPPHMQQQAGQLPLQGPAPGGGEVMEG